MICGSFFALDTKLLLHVKNKQMFFFPNKYPVNMATCSVCHNKTVQVSFCVLLVSTTIIDMIWYRDETCHLHLLSVIFMNYSISSFFFVK